MRFVCKLDSNTIGCLKAAGFKQKRNVFLRIHGDGVLQCVFLPRGSRAGGSNLAIAVRSIYEPDVFGDVSVYQGALTYPYDLDDFNIEKNAYSSQCDLLQRECIAKLDKTDTQESFCELITLLDTQRYGSVRWYMEMISLPSLMAQGQYAVALQKCDMVLAHNEELTEVIKMKSLLLTGDTTLIGSYLQEAKARNLHQYICLNYK